MKSNEKPFSSAICGVCGGRATRIIEEPLYPSNNENMCEACGPRYVAGRMEISNGPRWINIRPIFTEQ